MSKTGLSPPTVSLLTPPLVHRPPTTKKKDTGPGLMPDIPMTFKVFLSARFCAAIWSHITDCDETFNYWEPLHYLMYGRGLQTWEYSPEFALRSYTYLLVHGVPAWTLYKQVFHPTPMLIFYFIRCMLALACTVAETYFYKAVCREFGIHIGRLWLIFQLFSPGMFVSSIALLPSSFSMYLTMAAMTAWWHQRYKLAILFVALSALLGWPFAALVGLPVAVDMLYKRRMFKTFALWSGIALVTILIPMAVIDSSYFGKVVLAPLNLVLYNIFTSHGPNIYGTEPFTFYLFNGFLNYNIVWLLALLTPLLLVACHLLVKARSKSTLNLPHYLSLAPLYIWLVVFWLQPHKEERFLFPIYPMIGLCGAVSLDVLQKLFYHVKTLVVHVASGSHYLDHTMSIAGVALIVSTVLGASRTISLYKSYHAPLDVMVNFNEFAKSNLTNPTAIYNVCLGKEWHRFPGSFFLPTENYRIRFLRSEFKGMLPDYFQQGAEGSQFVSAYFNDQNRENEAVYFDPAKCHFLFDYDSGRYTDLEPDYAGRKKEWEVLRTVPFLDTSKTHRLLRAFYIPFVSERHVVYRDFNLLMRRRLKLSPKV